ncbi:endolytic transglycosylase MltG [Clostridium bovifaecis]|uniref:Endolytic murein transglycosylase n=1 Tax=Clostridium bovifaecis TaxID=2184719 RepID=A0A6I6F254_9CLOT|nr:endolytic transglycosylase MltG [Clostridium bovifaecis]
MKRLKGIVIVLVLFIIVLIGFNINSNIKHPFVTTTDKVSVVVNEGESLFNVIRNLENKKLIKNAYIIKLYIKGKKFDTNIKPGEYDIDGNISVENLVKILNGGIKNKGIVKVTIPEGYDIEAIADVLDKNDIISREDFIKSCKNYKLPEYIKANSKAKYALEGFLFPDTYELKRDSSGKDIIDKMLSRFETIFEDIKDKNNEEIDDVSRVITLASIIEKEARIDEDRTKIASVFNNRLKRNMMLQVDATVLYAIGEHKEKLYYKDLKIDSPYNTYKVKGLPPGPICSPGRSSIEAALNPDKTNYVFYVLEDNKKHYFTDNYKDFLKAKERYKNIIK